MLKILVPIMLYLLTYILCIISVKLVCPGTKSRYGMDKKYLRVLIYISTFLSLVLLIIILLLITSEYKRGQIDYAEGKIKYEKISTKIDTTYIWKEIPEEKSQKRNAKQRKIKKMEEELEKLKKE